MQHAEEVSLPSFTRVHWWNSLLTKILIAFIYLLVCQLLILFLLVGLVYWPVLKAHAPQEDWVLIRSLTWGSFLLLEFFFVTLSLLIAFLLSRSVTDTLGSLMQGMEKMAHGDAAIKLRVSRRDELGSMSLLFNHLAAKMRELQHRNKILTELKSRFAAVAAHELRTPLTGLQWSVELLLAGKAGLLSAEQKKIIEQQKTITLRMTNLVNELLDATKTEEAGFGYNFRPINLSGLIEETVRTFSLPAQIKNVSLELKDQSTAQTPPALIDQDRIKLVLANLIDNAIRYSPHGGRVLIRLIPSRDFLRVSIQDSGIGIPTEEQAQIFTRFFRGANAMKVQTQGSGLGLFITKTIVEHHGGKMWFISQEGRGSTFYFTVPLRKELIPQLNSVAELVETI